MKERVVGERVDNPSQAPRPSLWKTVSLSLHVFPSLSHGGGDSRKFVFSSNCVNASAPQSGAHHCAILAARASVRPDLSDAQNHIEYGIYEDWGELPPSP